MIALKITNVKKFMGKLLASEAFDSFVIEEASISTYNTFLILAIRTEIFILPKNGKTERYGHMTLPHGNRYGPSAIL